MFYWSSARGPVLIVRTVSNKGSGPFTSKINFEPHELEIVSGLINIVYIYMYVYFNEISASIKTRSDQIKISTQKTHLKCKLNKKLQNYVSLKLFEISLSCLLSPSCSQREVKSPYFLQVWWALCTCSTTTTCMCILVKSLPV